MIVKHDGKTLLDKVFVLAKPYEGYCLVAWVNQGISFGIFCTTVRTVHVSDGLHADGDFSPIPARCRVVALQADVILDPDPKP